MNLRARNKEIIVSKLEEKASHIDQISQKSIEERKDSWKFIKPLLTNKGTIARNSVTLGNGKNRIRNEYKISKTHYNTPYITPFHLLFSLYLTLIIGKFYCLNYTSLLLHLTITPLVKTFYNNYVINICPLTQFV